MQRTPIILMIAFICTLFSCNNEIKYPDGGYAYPEHVDDKDTNFYYYPLKDKESRRDSFWDADDYMTYRQYDEPNLSIKPQSEDVFRFTYSTAFGPITIINLRKNEITVKKDVKGGFTIIPAEYNTNLTDLEKFHLQILNRRFPLDAPQKKPYIREYLDSLIQIYPQLLDVNYYQSLVEKTIEINTTKPTYYFKKISIKENEFKRIVTLINESGFWTKPDQQKCEVTWTDGDGFSLEANTLKKYNIYNGFACPNDHGKFLTALEALIKAAQMDNEIGLIWSDTVDSISTQTPMIIQDIQLQEVVDSTPKSKSSKSKHK